MGGVEVVRLQGVEVSVPVRTYRHPDTGRRVTAAGMIHFGEVAFFADVRDRVDRLVDAGAVVQSERMRPDDDGERVHGATDREAEVVRLMARVAGAGSRFAIGLGWVGQWDGLGRPDWPAVDLPFLDVLRLAGVERLARQAKMASRMIAAAGPRREHLFRLMLHATVRQQRRVSEQPARGMDAAIVDARTDHAMTAADQVDGDVVLVWGTAHLPGFGRALRTRGFRQVDEVWLRVGRLPTIASCAWGVLSGRATQPTSTPSPAIDAAPS